MNFQVEKSIEILSRTPDVLNTLLRGLSPEWTNCNEGDDTWSPYVVIGHLIYGEEADWVPRMKVFLSNERVKKLPVFDRFAQFERYGSQSLDHLLDLFKIKRAESITELKKVNLKAADLKKEAIHPEFGKVTLANHLATWTAHDLTHIYQISRVMAKQYKEATGPWVKYLTVLQH